MSDLFFSCRVALAVLALVARPAAWAADPLTLSEAVRLASGRSQQLAAQDARISAMREQAQAAGQLPDPVLKLGVDNLPLSGPDRFSLTSDFMTMRRIGLMQEIPRGQKRQYKTEQFLREAQRVKAQQQLALARLQRDTALAWLDGYFARAMRELVQRQLEEGRLQVQGADTAYRGGKGSQTDVLAARATITTLEDRLLQLDRQARGAELALGRWLGEAATRPLADSPTWQTPLRLDELSGGHLEQHPELQAMRAEVDAAQTDALLAQANKQADWTVEASYSQRGPAYANMLSVGLSIPLQWDTLVQNRL
jgi:outer membrane protein TolC